MTAREIAEVVAEQAKETYLADGHLVPVLMFRNGDREVTAMLRVEDNMPDVVALVGGAIGAIVRPQYLVLVSETWSKQFRAADGENLDPARLPPVERGQLGRMHEAGDTDVHTSILVSAWDMVDLNHSLTILQDADEGFRREEIPGPGAGAIADAIQFVVKTLPRLIETKPSDLTIDRVANMLAGSVEALMVEWDTDEPMPEGAIRIDPDSRN
jgi:ribonucleotide monophosphatase NagD (HAD superfamily)